MRKSSGMSCTITMLFFWHHTERGMRMTLENRVKRKIAAHQLPVRS